MLKDGLVVIDVQYGLSAAHHYKQLLANINQRIDAYHAADHPIIFMQHTDESMPYNGHDWQLDTQLHRAPSDRVILSIILIPFSKPVWLPPYTACTFKPLKSPVCKRSTVSILRSASAMILASRRRRSMA
mgnify:CR=1 FL=1